jgi:hypothetical protein
MTLKQLALSAVFLALASNAARAENCGKSREYLLGNLSGDLALPPRAYEDLLKTCLAAVVAKQDSVAATAATRSQFCDANPGLPCSS